MDFFFLKESVHCNEQTSLFLPYSFVAMPATSLVSKKIVTPDVGAAAIAERDLQWDRVKSW
jgi:hypothetical protein